ncbi:hypothetical protein CUPS3785_06715 [Campylobacter upsaliensis]|uniref:hypothetical protein n=1 Tax=Campylobacter upsaliensis TaxID=28080 RepID=UPI002149E6A8|nr:hypothetical protein [Campylobacter upsaliensis]MCR2122768.1 hypothetical protein [Campylobacter upsaliensis]
MARNIFHVGEYVNEETQWLDNFLKDLEHTNYDKHQYIDEYCSHYQAKLEEFFDSEYGEAFNFDDNHKKNFLLDIYAYASFDDFCSFNAYKKSAGEFNNALNYLSHIPHDFHLELYQNHQELFGDLKFSEIDTKVEELFFKLHQEVYNKFEDKIALLNETLPLFVPNTIEELEFLQELYDDSTINLQNILKANHISLYEKNEYLLNYLQNEVFGEIYIPSTAQQAYDKQSLIFDEPCNEFFMKKALNTLIGLDYEVAVFKDDDAYIFAYANNKEHLKEAFNYLNEAKHYEFDSENSTKDFPTLYEQETNQQQRTRNMKR